MTLLHYILITGFASAGLITLTLNVAFRFQSTRKYVISDDPHRNIDDKELYGRVAVNMVVSLSVILAIALGFEGYLFHADQIPLWRHVLEFAGVVFIYDFVYYFVHRYPFHEWSILRNVHAVHHAAQYPRALDALLLHPTETFLGLAALFGSIFAVGSIHYYTFAVIFIGYTSLNVLNHAGVNVTHFPMRTLGWLADKHDKHHHSMLSGNYASITPIPDMVFGTVE